MRTTVERGHFSCDRWMTNGRSHRWSIFWTTAVQYQKDGSRTSHVIDLHVFILRRVTRIIIRLGPRGNTNEWYRFFKLQVHQLRQKLSCYYRSDNRSFDTLLWTVSMLMYVWRAICNQSHRTPRKVTLWLVYINETPPISDFSSTSS